MEENKRNNRRANLFLTSMLLISLICLGISLYLSIIKYPLNPLENDIFQATNMTWKVGFFNIISFKFGEYLTETYEHGPVQGFSRK